MLIAVTAAVLSMQAAPLEDGDYTARVACMASLSAASELGPARDQARTRDAMMALGRRLDAIDQANQDDPSVRTEMFGEMRESQIAVNAWQFNVERCLLLAREDGAASAAGIQPVKEVRSPPAAAPDANVARLFGRLMDSRELETALREIGWEYRMGAVANLDDRQHDERWMTAFNRRDARLIISQRLDHRLADGSAVFRIEDAVQMSGFSASVKAATDCTVGTDSGGYVPGLVALVNGDVRRVARDELSATNGPATAAWRIDLTTGMFQRQEGLVWCYDMDYGSDH